MTTFRAARWHLNLTEKTEGKREENVLDVSDDIQRLMYTVCPRAIHYWPVNQSFLQFSTGHQGAAHEHVAHDDVAAPLHEGFCGSRVEGTAAWDEAESLQTRAAGQSLKE